MALRLPPYSGGLSQAKADMIAATKAYADGIRNGGWTYTLNNGTTTEFNIDDEAATAVNEVKTEILAGEISPHLGVWKDYYNVDQHISDSEFIEFSTVFFITRRAIKFSYWAHRDEINNLTTIKEVLNYDYTGGWPPH